jgi:GT2 family glycosyltransferase
MSKVDLSIIIVNYKTPKLTRDCIASIHEYTNELIYEIIVVDNHSEDDSEKVILTDFPDTKWVPMSDNSGTSRGYNAGVKNAQGNYVLILNSDTVVMDNAIKNSLDFHKEKENKFKVGMTSCQIKGFDNIIQYNSNPDFPSLNKYLSKHPFFYRLGFKSKKKPNNAQRLELHQRNHETSWIGIAFGIINREIFDIGGHFFDEDIFMYSDEVEWCHRLKKLGYRHFFTADYTICHINSGSSVTSEWRYGQIFLSELLFYYKTHGRFMFKLILASIKYFQKKNDLEKDSIEKNVMDQYSKRILNEYSPKISSGKTYLKYEL